MATVHYVGLSGHSSARAECTCWSLRGQIDWREWDGEVVARVEETAATFLISALAGEVLNALRDGGRFVGEIAERIFSDPAPEPACLALVAKFADSPVEIQDLLNVLIALEAKGLVRADRA